MVTSYKVIEERVISSGRVEYLTLPLYHRLHSDAVEGKIPMIAESKEWARNKIVGIHSFVDLEEAKSWMDEHFIGYTSNRVAIYRCESDDDKCRVEGGRLISMEIHFREPLFHMVNHKIYDYSKPVAQEKKKSPFGIVYDESEITGDVEQNEE